MMSGERAGDVGEAPRSVMLYAVPIGTYEDPEYGDLSADDEAECVSSILDTIGVIADRWPVSGADRTMTAANRRVRSWSTSARRRIGSILYWVGHGYSNGDDAWLATADSAHPIAGTGVRPEQLADHIFDEWLGRRSGDGSWSVFVVEACGASRFVDLLLARLLAMPDRPHRLAVIGIGGLGQGNLGEFAHVLQMVLDSYTDNDNDIQIGDLVGRLRRRVGDGAVHDLDLHLSKPLQRRRVMPQTIVAPVDVYETLRDFLSKLPVDVRTHFIPKAQGAEHNEVAWYFVGRTREQQEIATWLAKRRNGMLIVTGPPGGGKSALLGAVLARSNQKLFGLLVAAGLVDPSARPAGLPDNPFDVVLHLTGMTLVQVVRGTAETLGIHLGADTDVYLQIDALLRGVTERGVTTTVLVDALDESQEPAVIASSLLRRLAATVNGRVVVGTRRSTADDPDAVGPPDVAADLLEALGGLTGHRSVVVDRDSSTMFSYVQQRLVAARVQDRIQITDERIASIAGQVAATRHQLLFARLAVHEILADPRLAATSRTQELDRLLNGNHRAMFGAALNRLADLSPANLPLLEALSLAQGRGLPRVDAAWMVVASALADDMVVTEADVDALLTHAAPYIMLDADRRQTVYRLAHRTFTEHFSRHGPVSSRHEPVCQRLILDALRDISSTRLSQYTVFGLPGHIASSERWDLLLDEPDVLDRVDPITLRAELLRTVLGRRELDPELAAVVRMAPRLAAIKPAYRTGTRQVGRVKPAGGSGRRHKFAAWTVSWSSLTSSSEGITVAVLRDAVFGLVDVPLLDGRTLLATAQKNGLVELVDPVGNAISGDPLVRHSDAAVAIVFVPGHDPHGGVLASASRDGVVKFWNPSSGREALAPLVLEPGGARALAVAQDDDGSWLLLTASRDGVIRSWEPRSGAGRRLIVDADEMTTCMCVGVAANGETVVALAGDSGSISVHRLRDGKGVGRATYAHSAGITSMTMLGASSELVLASGGHDEMVRLWDIRSGLRPRADLSGHAGTVRATAAVTIADRQLLASSGDDRSIRLWDLDSDQMVAVLRGHSDGVRALTALKLGGGGRSVLASAGFDQRVRIWDPPFGVSEQRTLGLDAVAVTAVAVTSWGLVLATRAGLRVLNPGNGEVRVERRITGSDPITAIAEWEAGVLVVGTATGQLFGWHPGRRKQLWHLPHAGSASRIRCLAAAWDGAASVVVGCAGKTVFTVRTRGSDASRNEQDYDDGPEVMSWKPMRVKNSTPFEATSMTAFSASRVGSILALAHDGVVEFWNLRTRRQIAAEIVLGRRAIIGIAPVRVGRHLTALATVALDARVHLWRVDGSTIGDPLDLGEITPTGLAVQGTKMFVSAREGVLALDLHIENIESFSAEGLPNFRFRYSRERNANGHPDAQPNES